MKAKSIFSLFLGIVFFGSIIFASAQNEDVQEKQRRRTRDNITTLMLLRMTRFLELSEEQTVKIYPFFTRIEKEKAEINKQIRKHMQDLRMKLRGEDLDLKALEDGIQAIKKLREALKSKDAEVEKHLEENLTVVQQAKYLMFVTAFLRELRDNVDRARQMREKARVKKKKII
jgi:predicted nucleotide-binding protein (sugar kinase/HSP70/actin superfamily)